MNSSLPFNENLSLLEEEMAVHDLRVGMFVSRLDCEWGKTPFLLQGFLIEEEEVIRTIKEYCRWVYIDRTRSVGQHYKAPVTPNPSLAAVDILKGSTRVIIEESLPIYRGSVWGRFKAFFGFGEEEDIFAGAPVKLEGISDTFKDDLAQSTQVLTNTQQVIESVLDDIRNTKVPNMKQVNAVVGELIFQVSKNPSAMIWASRLRDKHNYTYEQLINVSIHLVNFGRFLGLNSHELNCLGLAGFVQDFGMARIPQDIVYKKGKLTQKEREIVQEHVKFSIEILEADPTIPKEVMDIVIKHHERIDGSGYPRGLSGGLIGVQAEIAGLVDSYCAMTQPRPYRSTYLQSHAALNELYSQRGKVFGEIIVEQFVQCIGIYPPGTIVELNSNEVGIVIQQHTVRRLQPQIMIVLDAQHIPYKAPIMLDLLTNPYINETTPYCIKKTLPEGSYGINPKNFYL
jgi:HD-GYP domain-containing protein (c-di-GMP phosphodiesterase class II)